MKAYKVFDSDWKCRNFQYEIGETYKHNGEIRLCESGFHACVKLVDCFDYYDFNPNNKVAEVELLGNVIHGEDKSVCSSIRIVRELSWNDVSESSNSGNKNSGDKNSGHWNSGDKNSGDRNTGHRNSGHCNSGHRNSGHCNSGHSNTGHGNSGNKNSGDKNSGHWNSGDKNSGFFNTTTPNNIEVFNNSCSSKLWEDSNKPDFLYFAVTKWITESEMSESEKENCKNYSTTGGYLKRLDYKSEFKASFDRLSASDRTEQLELLEALPNFDWDIFTEISGIERVK